jgi:putative ABC transport system permease protein
MTWLRVVFSRLRGTFQRSRVEEELRFHIDMEAEANERRGLSQSDARAEAIRAMGGAAQHADRYHDAQGFPLIDSLARDLQYAIRNLRSAPAFALTAAVTLAAGIGGTTAVFSFVHGVLLKPLPYPQPERLAAIWSYHPQIGLTAGSMPDFLDLRNASRTTDLAAYHRTQADIISPGPPETVDGAAVSASFFRVLGTAPVLGRTPAIGEERQKWAVLSYRLWQTRFGGDSAVLGKAVSLGGTAHIIIGVMPVQFTFPDSARIWTPLSDKAWNNGRRGDFLMWLGRLRSGESISSVQSELEVIASRLEKAYPADNSGRTVRVSSLHGETVKNSKAPLLVLFGAVGCLLLIACANVANLMLARGTSRSREMLVRMALGASRKRLVFQLLVESVLLSAIGGLLGVLAAKASVDAFIRFKPVLLPRMNDIQVDTPALLFALATAMATGILFGLIPALKGTRLDLAGGLRTAGRPSAPSSMQTMRVLTVWEIAIATCLLVGAGLFVRSLLALTAVDPGYRAGNILVARVSLDGSAYPNGRGVREFHERLIERVKELPGVISAATATGPPSRGGNYNMWIEEGEVPQVDRFKEANFRGVSLGYLETVGVRLLSGRDFAARDTGDSESVVLVNDALVRKHFGGRSPVGKRIQADGHWRRIIGVVADTHQEGLAGEAREEILFPMAQRASRGVTLLVRTQDEPESHSTAIRSVLSSLDPERPVQLLTTLRAITDMDLSQPRFGTYLIGSFAGLALFLAALGVYGVTAYGVGRRSHEIGVRMALGADVSNVRRMVLGSGLRLAFIGVTFGAVLAAMLARAMTAMLFGIGPYDLVSFVSAAVLFFSVVAVACYLPARRATLVDPAAALRAD